MNNKNTDRDETSKTLDVLGKCIAFFGAVLLGMTIGISGTNNFYREIISSTDINEVHELINTAMNDEQTAILVLGIAAAVLISLGVIFMATGPFVNWVSERVADTINKRAEEKDADKGQEV